MRPVIAKLRVAFLAGLQVFSLGVVLAQGAPVATPEWQLAAPTHRATFAGVRLPGLLVPNWTHGFMITRAQGDTDPADVNVVLYDRTGTRATQARIWLPGAVRVHLYDAIATDQGDVIASGYAVMADRTLARFIARTDSSGKVVDVVNTNPFNPECVCLSSDGTVWSLGVEADKDDRHEDYPLVRHYSLAKGLLGTYLSRDSFPRTTINPAWVAATSAISSAQATYLRCDGSTAWLYINATDQVVRIDPSTKSETRFQVDMASLGGVKVRGFAVTDDGHLFAGLANCRMQSTRLYELQPDRSTLRAKWVAVDDGVPTAGGADWLPGSFVQLWGAEGQSLVVEKMGEPDGLSWAPVIRVAAQLP